MALFLSKTIYLVGNTMLDRKTRLIFESILEGKRKPALRPSRIEEIEDDEEEESEDSVGEPEEPASTGSEETQTSTPEQSPAPATEPSSSIDWENVKFIGTGGIARYQEIGDDNTKEVNLSRFSRLKPEDIKQARSLLRQIDVLSYLASDIGSKQYEKQIPDESKRLNIENLRKVLQSSGLYSNNISRFDIQRKTLLDYARNIENQPGQKQKVIESIRQIQDEIGPLLDQSPETIQFVKNLTSGSAGSVFNLRSNKNWKAFITLINSFYGEPTQLDLTSDSEDDDADENLEESKQIVIDLSRNNGILNESFVSMFSYWIKKIIQHFLDGIHIPVKVVGSERDVEAFARALSSEKNFLMKAQKYGLTDKRTYSSKYELDKAVNGFQKETGIRWPFK